MKYISIDLETTGIPEKDGLENIQAIQLGAILEDTNDPKAFADCEKFQCIIEHPRYGGNPYALNLNAWIFDILGQQEKYHGEGLEEYRETHSIIPIDKVSEELWKWIVKIGYDHEYNKKLIKITNTADIDEALAFCSANKQSRVAPRGPRLYFNVAGKNFDKFDRLFMEIFPRWESFLCFKGLAVDPGNVCLDFKIDKRTPGLQMLKDRYKIAGIVTHDALEDAWDVIQVLRKKY